MLFRSHALRRPGKQSFLIRPRAEVRCVGVGVAKGKKQGDKRETSAKRDWERQKARVLKHGARE